MPPNYAYEGGAYRGLDTADMEQLTADLAQAANVEELLDEAVACYDAAQRRLDDAASPEAIESALQDIESARLEQARILAIVAGIDYAIYDEF